MRTHSKADVVAVVRRAQGAARLRHVFGRTSVRRASRADDDCARAIAACESSRLVITFSSRFDACTAGERNALSGQEKRGLALSNGDKALCSQGHPSGPGPYPTGLATGRALVADHLRPSRAPQRPGGRAPPTGVRPGRRRPGAGRVPARHGRPRDGRGPRCCRRRLQGPDAAHRRRSAAAAWCSRSLALRLRPPGRTATGPCGASAAGARPSPAGSWARLRRGPLPPTHPGPGSCRAARAALRADSGTRARR